MYVPSYPAPEPHILSSSLFSEQKPIGMPGANMYNAHRRALNVTATMHAAGQLKVLAEDTHGHY
jgi:hypothetical protein